MALLGRTEDQGGQPLTRRLAAWWRGAAGMRQHAPETPWGDPRVSAHNPGQWDAHALKAAQMIWGHSLLGPCSPDELAGIMAWLRPRRGMRIALLGAGLGGLGLAMSRISHCRVVGFEQADMLLSLCPDRNEGHLRSLDSITTRTERSFDHAVIDGLAHRAGDILPLVPPAAALVSLCGTILIRAYCVADEHIRRTERYQEWRQAEAVQPVVPTRNELRRQVEHAGFAALDEAEIGDIHVGAIDRAWATAVDLIRLLNGKPRQRIVIPVLLQQADLWRTRVEMIRAGDIKVIELLAKRTTL